MNYLADAAIVAALMLTYITAGVIGATALTRIGISIRDWLNRNAR